MDPRFASIELICESMSENWSEKTNDRTAFFLSKNSFINFSFHLSSSREAEILVISGIYRAMAHVNLFRWSVTVRDACISCTDSSVLPPPRKLCMVPARSGRRFSRPPSRMFRTTFTLSDVRKGIISIWAPVEALRVPSRLAGLEYRCPLFALFFRHLLTY